MIMNNFETVRVDRNNFPFLPDLRTTLYNMQFDNLLNFIKDKIVNASRMNQTFVRILNNELNQYNESMVNDVKAFLITRGYTIIVIEDQAGVSIGWKINF
jgi:hypothetical protein